jgi:hypothetical protein
MAILMTAIVLIAITSRPEKKTTRFGWDSLSMLVTGALSMYFAYLMG